MKYVVLDGWKIEVKESPLLKGGEGLVVKGFMC